MCQIVAGASVGHASLLKLTCAPNTSGNQDNRRTLLNLTIMLKGTITALTQSYDAVNRLQAATEVVGSSQLWKQTSGVDRFGNQTPSIIGQYSDEIGMVRTHS